MIPFRLLTLTLFVAVSAGSCPEGSYSIPNENICVFPMPDSQYYIDAVRRCLKIGGMTAKIANVFENGFISSLLFTFNGTAPYIGIERKSDNRWVYADGSPLTYQNWATGEPNLNSSTNFCALMDPGTGKWVSTDCFSTRPYLCTGKDLDVSTDCLDGWSYFRGTDSCYYLWNFTYVNGNSQSYYTWDDGVRNCKELSSSANLASIHSMAENDFLYDLVQTYYPTCSTLATDVGAWIGFTGNYKNGNWSDGSPFDFVDPNIQEIDDSYRWVISNVPACNYRRWSWMQENRFPARFICEMPSNHRLGLEKVGK
ncbi:unnamed protein product, partial [Mesorhabditis belari]|uniref:C-type lectin domain-containing protein n=1 Tax=Mesorhabditis belari TaxID=2138241 RepID=A0AAF3ETM4_9BILA